MARLFSGAFGWPGLCFAALAAVQLGGAPAPEPDRLRLMIETDAGGDPDDEQSLVRFLLYVNEWDVEGIVANRPRAIDGENLNRARDGLGIVRALVEAYRACYPSLVRHDPRYPEPRVLLERTVAGYADRKEAVDLLVAAVDGPDPRPLWFANWGTNQGSGPSCLERALDRVLAERGPEGYAKFKSRLRLASDDQFGKHTTALAPPFPLWVDTFRPPRDGKRWYHRFSALTATAGGFEVERDLRRDHGPLGALYPLNTTHPQKEGDTMTFLYLVPTGMNDPQEPGWGSWAGRYGPREGAEGRPYYWANQEDEWQGKKNRDHTLLRWAADLQNDFRARLDWCVKPPSEANHRPAPMLNGRGGREILRLEAPAGSKLELSAAGSTDPDGQPLAYEWFVYREAGTWSGPVKLEDADRDRVRVEIPDGAAGKTIHLILRLFDRGSPPLAAYRRAVITVGAPRG